MTFAQMFPGMEWMFAIIGFIILLLMGAAVAGLVLILKGIHSDPAKKGQWKRRTALLFIGSALLAPPMLCCFGRGSILPASNADLREKIVVGMTAKEVKSILGESGDRVSYNDGTGHWYYACDWWGFDYFMVSFGANGRVISAKLVG